MLKINIYYTILNINTLILIIMYYNSELMQVKKKKKIVIRREQFSNPKSILKVGSVNLDQKGFL